MAYGAHRARSASGFCFTAWENHSVALLSERSGLRCGLDRARGLWLVASAAAAWQSLVGLLACGCSLSRANNRSRNRLHVFCASSRHPALGFFSARSCRISAKFCQICSSWTVSFAIRLSVFSGLQLSVLSRLCKFYFFCILISTQIIFPHRSLADDRASCTLWTADCRTTMNDLKLFEPAS